MGDKEVDVIGMEREQMIVDMCLVIAVDYESSIIL